LRCEPCFEEAEARVRDERLDGPEEELDRPRDMEAVSVREERLRDDFATAVLLRLRERLEDAPDLRREELLLARLLVLDDRPFDVLFAIFILPRIGTLLRLCSGFRESEGNRRLRVALEKVARPSLRRLPGEPWATARRLLLHHVPKFI
jgi:hypothetical protein